MLAVKQAKRLICLLHLPHQPVDVHDCRVDFVIAAIVGVRYHVLAVCPLARFVVDEAAERGYRVVFFYRMRQHIAHTLESVLLQYGRDVVIGEKRRIVVVGALADLLLNGAGTADVLPKTLFPQLLLM